MAERRSRPTRRRATGTASADARERSRLVVYLPLAVAALVVAMAAVLYSDAARGAPQHAAAASAAVPSMAATASAPAPTAQSESDTYVVRKGDSLWRIFHAEGIVADTGMSWPDFLAAMRSRNDLSNPDLLHPGKVLTVIPRKN